MSDLALSPETFTAYLDNIVGGKSMRQIARAEGCEPSTVLRRIRRCEDLREHPEWDAVFNAVEKDRQNNPATCRQTVNRKTIARALIQDVNGIHVNFAAHMHILTRRGAMILTGDVEFCAICDDVGCKGALSRKVVLAALAFGWIKPFGNSTGEVRKFRVTEGAMECVTCGPPPLPHLA